MQSGELNVTGHNSIQIPLDAFPSEVKVHFKDDVVVVPCNAGQVDFLEYEVRSVPGGFVLLIKWQVSGVRDVKWHAAY